MYRIPGFNFFTRTYSTVRPYVCVYVYHGTVPVRTVLYSNRTVLYIYNTVDCTGPYNTVPRTIYSYIIYVKNSQ